MVASKKNCAGKLCRPLPLMAIAANGNALAKLLASRSEFARTLPKDIRDQGACQKFARKFSFLR